MSWDFEDINRKIQEDLNNIKDLSALEGFRVKYLGRKGLIAEILSNLGSLSQEERPQVGKTANELKQKLALLIDEKNLSLKEISGGEAALDFSLPGVRSELGNLHPITKTINEICGIFSRLGFKVVEGPEIETEFNNFTALNIPLDHPSRDGFDTFYIDRKQRTENREQNLLLRSHTSPVQIRAMKKYKPPLAVIVPGKVYRPDATDASHSFMFHQIEGFLVDEKVSLSDLKGVLFHFAKELFGKDIKMRFRPHFFPFTEPSAEADISCIICQDHPPSSRRASGLRRMTAEVSNEGGQRCSVCGGKGWLEILGAGMIHPNVFKAVGYPKGKYTGFAFGMGVDRIAMLKYGVNDIRLFYENDLRFLRQF